MTEQVITHTLGNYELQLLVRLVDILEANQRNAESSSTACLAAGGGTNEETADRLAGREPCDLEAFICWMEERERNASRLLEYDDLLEGEVRLEKIRFAKRAAFSFIEARRRTQDA